MTHNPHEPHPPGPFEAAHGAPVRRGANYRLPPIGSGHHLDAVHLRRQEWTGRLLIWGVLIAPVVYFIGWDLGWW